MGVTGRRGRRLLVLVSSAINIADNDRAAGWAEIALELVAVAIWFIRQLLQVVEQKRRVGW